MTVSLRDSSRKVPGLSAQRLFDEVRAAGYPGGYSRVRDYVRAVRPREPTESVVRFKTPAERQGQVDFATFTLRQRQAEGAMHGGGREAPESPEPLQIVSANSASRPAPHSRRSGRGATSSAPACGGALTARGTRRRTMLNDISTKWACNAH